MKEPSYFNRRDGNGVSLCSYSTLYPPQLPGSNNLLFEASPDIIAHPVVHTDVLQTLAPGTKYIIMLRNPVDRSFSHWKFARALARRVDTPRCQKHAQAVSAILEQDNFEKWVEFAEVWAAAEDCGISMSPAKTTEYGTAVLTPHASVDMRHSRDLPAPKLLQAFVGREALSCVMAKHANAVIPLQTAAETSLLLATSAKFAKVMREKARLTKHCTLALSHGIVAVSEAYVAASAPVIALSQHCIMLRRYGTAVHDWLKHAGNDVHIIISEDMEADTASTLQKVHSFLGVRDEPIAPAGTKIAKICPVVAGREPMDCDTVHKFTAEEVRDAATLTPELRARLARAYEPTVRRLKSVLGYDPGWADWPDEM